MPHKIVVLNKTSKLAADSDFGFGVLMGLESSPKHLQAKYLYDTKGSELFQKITETEDYYPTGCEAEIFTSQGLDICKSLNSETINLIELGAGDGRKTKILVDALTKMGKKVTYLPIDISESAIEGLVEKFSGLYPGMNINAVVGEYFEGLNWVSENSTGPNLMLFLGSNIGNFNSEQRLMFLRKIWNCMSHDDHILVGFDLKKDIEVLLHAYNDSEGATRDFNLNLLDRINRHLDGDFDRSKFSHYGTYNPRIGAMESYIISLEEQTVRLKGLEKALSFKAFEPIHIEYSFKFLPSEIESLSRRTGFSLQRLFTDRRDYFADALMKVEKDFQ